MVTFKDLMLMVVVFSQLLLVFLRYLVIQYGQLIL